MSGNKKTETSNIVTLRETVMRGSAEYENVMKNDKAEVSFYRAENTQGKDSRELDKCAGCNKETWIKLLYDCNVLPWKGFAGKRPEGVRDGILFILIAIVDQNDKMYVHGSEKFR